MQSRPRCSRADIARATGLSTSAVSMLVADLVSAGLLVELGTNPSAGGGRPSISLGLAPQAGSLVGIHLGHADLRVVLTSLDGAVLTEQRHFLDVDHEPAASLDRVANSTADLLAAGDVDPDRVLGTALAGVCTITDPSLVVVGGDLTARPDSSEALLEGARRALGLALPPVANHRVRIVRAELGARAEALGAALLAAFRSGARPTD